MNYTLPDFMVIDDDPINNRICQVIIKKTYPEANVISHTEPEKALESIAQSYGSPAANNTILLLDINMPVLSGWDVLLQFQRFPEHIIRKFRIYILSSSVDTEDKERAERCALVSGYIEKPLTIERARLFYADLSQWD